jgi:Family of unknown function (DUF6049)
LRRACCALAAGLLLTLAVLPGALLAGQGRAAASPARSGQPGGPPVTIAITQMSRAWASPGTTITVTGTVTNTSRTSSISHLAVRLLSSSVPVASLPSMQADLAFPQELADSAVTGHLRQPAGVLPPGGTSTWSISFPVSQIGMSAFGVYPLTAEVDDDLGNSLDYANTFLPYMPSKRSSRPARQPIAWLWPLIDTPLTGGVCSSPQAKILGASLAPGGRLADILAAGRSYAGADMLTWAVDPALLADASALAGCGAAQPGAAKAASAWLAQLRETTASQPLFVTPYANVSMSLIQRHLTADVQRAYTYGRQAAYRVLHRNVTPPSASELPGASPQVAGIAWPPDGIASYYTVATLAANANAGAGVGIRTVVLDSAKVDSPPGTAFRLQDGGTGYVRVLLSADPLTQLLGSATATPGSRFSAAQNFLAETALMAGPGATGPIVVAPPQRWPAPAGVAASVLAETADAPWLKPVSLTSVADGARSTDLVPGDLPIARTQTGSFSRSLLRQLRIVDQNVTQLASIQVSPNPAMYEAVAALESSAWRPAQHAAQLKALEGLAGNLFGQLKKVGIVVDSRVTLGGLKGRVPVLIDNRLGYPVRVGVLLHYHQPPGGGLLLEQSPKSVVTVRANGTVTITVNVQATQVGSTTITLYLLNQYGQRLTTDTGPPTVTVQATQFGNLALIILAAALGIFMIASAVRAVRRGPSPPDKPGDAGQDDLDAASRGQQAPGPDNVVRERTELGTAGTSGL